MHLGQRRSGRSVRRLRVTTAIIAIAALSVGASAQSPVDRPGNTILPLTAAADGKILATVPKPGDDGIALRLLHATTLRTGVGSSRLGLDRASFGPTRLMTVRRIGDKVAIQYENARFRASRGSASERAAVRDSFAGSTAWVGDVVATKPDGSFTFDIAPYLAGDVAGIAPSLQASGAKGYRQVEKASLADPASIKAFADNVEVDALQTFRSEEASPSSGITAPDPRQIGFVVHHSFVRLPGPGYAPRRLDPRVGGFGSQAIDFSAPLGDRIVYDLVNRFRLEKVDPSAARSPVKKPIVFYVDNAAPEPIRSALLDGVRWWSEAFDRAGFIDGFRAEILPDGIDPMDVRYNVVNWVNRETRGWSYGQVIADPRTGEIVKGSVLLGSLRVRQDMLIFDALLGASSDPNSPAVRAALARLRQLAAHEVGHALGLVHNFAASTQARASVMDYPAPRIGLVDGRPDLSDAYGVGLGDWDRFAVDWAYGAPPLGTDADGAARRKADAMIASGARFVSDADARAPGSAQPWGSLWDDGADPVAELERMLAVRQVALARFGPDALPAGAPLAGLRRSFVPVWLLHRYQVEAAAKFVGGVDYDYGVAGAGRAATPVAAADQDRAIGALLTALQPQALAVPPRLVPSLSAADEGNEDPQFGIEIMPTAGGPVFDPLAAADVGATMVLGPLLDRTRLSRLLLQHAADAAQPGVGELLDRLSAATVADVSDPLRRRIAYRSLMAIAGVALSDRTDPEVAAIAAERLSRTADGLGKSRGDGAESAWRRETAALLRDRERLVAELQRQAKPPEVPPGMPIGGADAGGWLDS
ncbi:DUF5117 domain-containing protein [Sphingosinicella sp. BN140058]|nr:DUF5117 domain-containing protein [Sphingosinicella sp. BN140058]